MKKVILIGDSIRLGYCGFVKALLADSTAVFYPEENCRFSQNILVGLSEWMNLGGDPAGVDLVHWNCGHWDMARWRGEAKPLNSPAYYGEMLRRIDGHLRVCFPNAKIIFALTTPMNPDGLTSANVRTTENVRIYNAIACTVMNELGVPINDLFSLMEKAPSSRYADYCHFTEDGYRMLAKQVAETIRTECCTTISEL